ncbi:MAG: response regulator [Acidobacteria bacterium]|nr:response regulator [Acidobacteriota bacterium]
MAAGLLSGPAAPEGDELARLKHQFLASLNHEIRTPLSGILGMTDLLLETHLDADQHEFAAATRQCAQNLLNVLNSTLEFSLLSAGGVELDQTEFHPADIVDSAVSGFQLQAEAKGLRLVSDQGSPAPLTVLGDARRFHQLLACLIDNAIKFTPAGEVAVQLRILHNGNSHADVEVLVRDTGVGMAPGKIEEIFESFHQLDGGLARAHSGLGLGLAIAQKLAQLMGGELCVNSEPGAGSCFTFRASFRLPAEPVAAPAGPAARPAREYRILVAEDNLIARKVVTHVLSRNGYRVDCAEHGQAAIEAARTALYDLILMDLQMPVVDGFAAATTIRALPGYASVPILAFTANSFSETRALCRENGMQGFLTKPVVASELLGALGQFLS